MSVKICTRCQGQGKVTQYIPGHVANHEEIKCSQCNGTGRMYRKEYSIEFPFDISTSEFNEVDSKIIHLIREFMESIKNKK